MRYVILLVVLSLLIACGAPVTEVGDVNVEQQELAQEPVQDAVAGADEPVLEPVAEEMAAEPIEDSEELPLVVDVYSELGCENLFSVEEFAKACGVDPAFVSKTFRTGTKNCYVSVRHIGDRASTAGIEAKRYDSPEKATEEFDRRLKVRLVGASDKTIPGARTYEFDQVGMHNIEFVKGDSIVAVHSSVALCPEDKLVELARIIGKRV